MGVDYHKAILAEIHIGNLCGPRPTGEAKRIKQESANEIARLMDLRDKDRE